MKYFLLGSASLLTCAALAACSSGGGTAAPGGGSGGFVTGAGGAFAAAGGATPSANGGDPGLFDTGGTSTGAGGDSCGASNFVSQLLPSNILLLVDRSGSMNCNLDAASAADCEAHPQTKDPTQPTRWSVITGALSSAIDQISNVPNTSVGLTFFSNDNVCGATSTPNVALAPLQPGGPQVAALKAALTNGKPQGGTPIIGATILAFKYLHEIAMAPGNRFVVLVTDGEDSCIPSTIDGGVGHATYANQPGYPGGSDPVGYLLTTSLPGAQKVNIHTFVIGAPGSEPGRGLLSKIAFAGNTAKNPTTCDHTSDNPAVGAECHFDMTASGDFAADLTAALQKITGQAVTCDFDVPIATDGKTVDPNKLNVDYYKGGSTAPADDTALFRDDTCSSTSPGWHFIDGSNQTKIRICPTECAVVQADPKANVNVSLSCAPQRIPR